MIPLGDILNGDKKNIVFIFDCTKESRMKLVLHVLCKYYINRDFTLKLYYKEIPERCKRTWEVRKKVVKVCSVLSVPTIRWL